MKRYIILTLTLLTLFLCASAAFAIFPVPDRVPTPLLTLQQGWFENTQAWYIDTFVATTNTSFLGSTKMPSLTPELFSLLHPKVPGGDIAARPIYVVLNPAATQGPIFSAAPGQDPPDALYSSFWQVFYIQWKPGAVKRPIVNAEPGDPKGLPDASQATIIPTGIVVQLPILAIGQLGGPWYPAPPGRYRMKQVFTFPDYAQTKLVGLSPYLVFSTDPVSKRPDTFLTFVTDVAKQPLADQIGANLAPGLLNVPDGTIDPADNDTQAFYWIPKSPWLCQYPVVESTPFGFGPIGNPAYTPVVRLIQLDRDIPYSTVLNNANYIKFLLTTGGLTVSDDENRMGILIPHFGG